jgi:hypothetical protein
MHARAPVFATPGMIRSGQPLIIKGKRGGTGRMSGSGPSGRKATPRALLARTLAGRTGVSAVVTERQARTVALKANPPKVIYGPLG